MRGLPRVEKTCPVCEKPWLVKASYIAKYPNATCSQQCRDARNRVQITCAVCETPITVKASIAALNTTGTTCRSAECIAELRSRNQIQHRGSADTRTATCGACGSEFTRKPNQIARYDENYCNRECRTAGMTGRPNPKLRNGTTHPCETCGANVHRTPATAGEHIFCSRECAGRPGQPRAERVERVLKECEGIGCGETLTLIPSEAKRYRFCSMSCANRGENGNFYRDGSARTPYAPGFTETLKKQIAQRDGHKCVRCGIPQGKGTHAVHHIDGGKTDHRPVNLVLLCRKCHGEAHWVILLAYAS